jgi:hypothetical protein
MFESGPILAVHGVVHWRVIDLAQWIFEDPHHHCLELRSRLSEGG